MAIHKVFISYHHANDEYYKNEFEKLYGHLFINKSVTDGDYNEDLSDDYVKRLIREDKITDSSVIVVLVGAETYKRKHVDWEISAGLSGKAGGYSGLLGIILPTYYNTDQNYQFMVHNQYNINTVPPRLQDNITSGYAQMYKWDSLQSYGLQSYIEEAFNNKYTKYNLIQNGREQFSYNR